MPKAAKKKKKAAKKPAKRTKAPKRAKRESKPRELDAGAVAAIALALQDEEIAAKRASQLNGASQWTSLARVRGVRSR